MAVEARGRRAKRKRKNAAGSAVKLTLLGREARKADPRLRVIANGDREVNAARADTCDSVALTKDVPVAPALRARMFSAPARPLSARKAKPALKTLPRDILVNVFISTKTGEKVEGITETDRIGRLATATIPLTRLRAVLDDPKVQHISLGQALRDPDPEITTERATLTAPERRIAEAATAHRFGEDVIIGIIDVGGFDFAHPDFLDAQGNTRFTMIWDQGARAEPGAPYRIGRIITRAQMNRAIAAARRAGAPATELEPQTTMVPGSHGTHVASIAAGNGGVCSRAEIAAVLISVPPEDLDRRKSFYDSTRIAHAVTYLTEYAKARHKPISINVSLGTNGHSHDASAPVNRWLDALLTEPERCVCVAAGNAGQQASQGVGDQGFIMGRIHSSGRIAAGGLTADLEWIVGGDGVEDYSENECEIWFAPQDRFTVELRQPGGLWTETIKPREFIENRVLPDGSFVSIYNELYHTANGLNRIALYLSPNLKTGAPVAAGKWVIRLKGEDVRDGRFHAWLERDDPMHIRLPDGRQVLRFPSYFSAASNVDNTSISTLACAGNVIAVANLDVVHERIHISSSQGPTRDGRPKPDIAAPGTDIMAANGFADRARPWIGMTGTSMASPYVCGVAGLMLATARAAGQTLTASQIAGILHRTALPLPGADYQWRDDAGFGRINPGLALRETANINLQKDRT
jgi:subtilisin family serine protease